LAKIVIGARKESRETIAVLQLAFVLLAILAGRTLFNRDVESQSRKDYLPTWHESLTGAIITYRYLYRAQTSITDVAVAMTIRWLLSGHHIIMITDESLIADL